MVPANGVFALRAAISEVDRLIARGLTQEEFDLTRDFLVSYSKLWARSLSDRLGFHLDSRFYDMPYFIDHIERELTGMTLESVNLAARKYLQTGSFSSVMITGNAAALRDRLKSGVPTPITYENPVAAEILQADRIIGALPINPATVRIVPIQETFEGRREHPR